MYMILLFPNAKIISLYRMPRHMGHLQHPRIIFGAWIFDCLFLDEILKVKLKDRLHFL